MDQASRLCRSALYIPGSKERALEKARDLPADAIIFDLEDAVAPEEKASARATLRGWLDAVDYGSRLCIVRVNALDTPWGRDDIAAFADARIDALLVTKVNRGADLDTVGTIAPALPIWAMMETAVGMLNAAEIAAHPRLTGMVMGTNDLGKELGARFRGDRLPLQTGIGLCMLAARAHGRLILDGVYNAFKDDEGLRAECEQGRDMGFDGKTLIHPAQLAIANTCFAPTAEEVDLAQRQIAAFEIAMAQGQGVAVVDGKLVEILHIVMARQTLAKARAIAALNA